jgi:hypothetical protein
MTTKLTRKLTPNERARIRARSGLADETISRVERGEPVREASEIRFERAAAEEGIALAGVDLSAEIGR